MIREKGTLDWTFSTLRHGTASLRGPMHSSVVVAQTFLDGRDAWAGVFILSVHG